MTVGGLLVERAGEVPGGGETAVRWRSLGAVPQRAKQRRALPVLGALAALYIAVWAPWQDAAYHESQHPLRFISISCCGLAVAVASPRRWWWSRPLVAGLAAAAILPWEGRLVALWLAMALLTAAWVTADRPPLPVRRQTGPGTACVAVAASAVAVEVGRPAGALWQPLAALAVGLLVLLPATRWHTRVGRLLRRAGEHLEDAVRVVLVVPAVAFAVAARALALAVLDPGRQHTASWLRTGAGEVDARSRHRLATDRWRRRRWVSVAIVVSLVAAVAAVVVTRVAVPAVADRTGASRGYSARAVGVMAPDAPVPAAYRGSSWFEGFRQDMAWALDEKVAWHPLEVQRVLDVKTRTVNVRDGVRASWTAPRCSCRRVEVWLYGGSGAFGVGQRDDHTIASELARAAAADGVALDVVNRGVPGELLWRNTTRLAWDLTRLHAPDLVVFYDGAEDVASVLDLERRGLGNVRAPFESFLSDLYDDLTPPPFDHLPDTAQKVGWPTVPGPQLTPGQTVAERYRRARQMSDDITAAWHVPARYFWQPSKFDQDPSTPAGAARASRPAVYRQAAAALPDDVGRLASAVAGVRRPLFYDDTDHNEDAARRIAAVMWASLRPQVEQLADEGRR